MHDMSNSEDSIVEWLWEVDGQFSVQQNPSFILNQEGIYDVILKIETQGGCLDTIVVNDAITYQPVKASVLHPELACLNDTVFN